MKVVIAGGRDYHLTRKDWQVIIFWRDKGFIKEVVSGCCKGVDCIAETWAEMNRISVKRFPADWDYGHWAGHIRNKQMAEYADAVILFPGGKGTASMRKLAKEYGLKILYDAEGK